MAEHQVLFCPFCRESFEQHERCPEHELPLVSFAELGTDPTAIDHDLDRHEGAPAGPSEDRPLGPYDPRLGRGWVALGALANVCALGLPVLRDAQALSLYRLARAVPSLWTLLLVSFTVLFALARRRTPRRLRSLRVLVPLLALLSPMSLGWAVARRIGLTGMVDIRLGSAVYVVLVASLLLLWGGVRLGAERSKHTLDGATEDRFWAP